jgi:hypothetical protein
VERYAIFRDDVDRERFIERACLVGEEAGVLWAHVLLDNHALCAASHKA